MERFDNKTVCYNNATLLNSEECDCEVGFGGTHCTHPIGGNPLKPREGECDKGWEGLTCRVCNLDEACNPYKYLEPTCLSTIHPIRQNYAHCNVTNSGLVAIEKRPLTVVWTCRTESCHLEFFFDKEESFWCGLTECTHGDDTTTCTNVKCKCIPGRTLCGKNGFMNLTDFFDQYVKGPGVLKQTATGFTFAEPALRDNLLLPMFGDESFNLNCNVGECIDKWESTVNPPKVKFNLYFPLIALVALAIIIFAFIIYRSRQLSDYMQLPHHSDQIPEGVDLSFSDISYQYNDKQILHSIHGTINKGQLCCIMGPSGAGKTTLLEILANRLKNGIVTGTVQANDQHTNVQSYQDIIGFVEQDDSLLDYLTVSETITTSAMLRLPRYMGTEEKNARVAEVMEELGITHVANSFIGGNGLRGISGGERRRVSIACELVKNPLILFLDEPTSGLDSYNALNVIQCLSKLAINYNRTIITTIHQPRSDIFAMFDQIILLSHGLLMYSGPTSDINSKFAQLGFSCPFGYNIADYVVDLVNTDSYLLLAARNAKDEPPEYRKSPSLSNYSTRSTGAHSIQPHVFASNTKPTLWTQFVILSRRTVKMLYRNPVLLFAHYISSIIIGVLLGCVYYKVTLDIAGIQNRMGCFFFICALFGFSCTSLITNINKQRSLYIKEKNNRLYHPAIYFITSVLFDVVPLRIIPPVLTSLVLYPLVGLKPELLAYLKFVIALVSFNVTSSSICYLVAVIIADLGTSTLVTTLTMLTSMLFSGLLLNTSNKY
eukprot:NODE_19_length_39463_cov_0.396073.p1 type:complete len:773 gc:universal NODE_19_length_39463_cov_0.396073:2944-626(-)